MPRVLACLKALQSTAKQIVLETLFKQRRTTASLLSCKFRPLPVAKVALKPRRWKDVHYLLLIGSAGVTTGTIVRVTSASDVQCEVAADEHEVDNPPDEPVCTQWSGSCPFSDDNHSTSTRVRSHPLRYFDADYEPTKVLGRGSFGVVMQCLHQQTGRVAAVKMLQQSAGHEDEIEREKRALARLESAGGHVNIVGYQDAYYHNDFHYIVLEYVSGTSLHSFLEQHRTLDASWSLKLVSQLASALQFMHAADVVHRDLKPENIMAIEHCNDADGSSEEEQNKDVVLKIIDFGSGGRASQPESIDKPRTATLSGTRCYWPPEVLQCQDMTTAMDMWALGCILYILIAGRHPFDLSGTSTEDEILLRVKTEAVSFLTPVWHNVPGQVKDLIRGLLDKNPRRRLSAAQVLEYLSRMNGTAATTSLK